MIDLFSYALPPERIAQRPVHPYDAAKLLVAEPSGRLEDSVFSDIAGFLKPDDLIVFNNTKVIAARLFGEIGTGDGAKQVELLLLNENSDGAWRCLARPMKKLVDGTRVRLLARPARQGERGAGSGLEALVLARVDDKLVIRLGRDRAEMREIFERCALMPIPPYIRKGVSDQEDLADYQPHFAAHEGSVAAPTASLHFTPELLKKISARGCDERFVTLHVGRASFSTVVRDGTNELQRPEAEVYLYSRDLIEELVAARKSGRRVIAVGTTVVRALEAAALVHEKNEFEADCTREADIFILPGHRFRLVSALVTNFHQPGTTHLLLVEALLGRAGLSAAYAHALANDYRFLSYGDGMFIPSGINC